MSKRNIQKEGEIIKVKYSHREKKEIKEEENINDFLQETKLLYIYNENENIEENQGKIQKKIKEKIIQKMKIIKTKEILKLRKMKKSKKLKTKKK